jgi:adenylate cyclase
MTPVTHSSKPRLTYATVNYRPRIIGFSIFALMLVTLPDEQFLGLRLLLAAVAMAWPHIAYVLAKLRGGGRETENRNIILDSVVGGCIAAGYALRLWPTTTMFCMGAINALLVGGPKFLAIAAVVWGAALTASLFLFGIPPHLETEPLATGLGITAIVAYIAVIGSTAYRLRRRQRETRAALEHEQRQSYELLLNVFPRAVIPRLNAQENPIADQFADATVIFADIVDFTPLAERLGPKRTVLLLNEVFRAFDQAAARLGIEKIETTGDGYLAVAGAPSALDDHPKAAADFAFAVLDAVRTTPFAVSEHVQIRVGLHTGPLFGGVIGQSRFHYKIFGETVNVASRIQSQSRPGHVLISESTYKRLQESHAAEDNGIVDLKGHGPMRTYWLVGRCTPALSSLN